jgi:phosphatidate cytidylyltransferase
MLKWRLILGTVFVVGLVGLCWLDWHAARPGIWLLPLAIVAALLGAGELVAMYRKRGHEPLAWAVYIGTLLTVLAAALPGLWPDAATKTPFIGVAWIALGFAASMLVAFAGELRKFDGTRRSTIEIALAVFAIAYAGALTGFLVQMRLLDGDGRLGMFALVTLIATVKMSDIGQYTAGRLFGKHKLAPVVSPGKTWEGLFGGFVFAGVTSWVLFNWGYDWFGLPWSGRWGESATWMVPLSSSAYAAALTVAGVTGDLTESMLKRDAGVKDSSSWMPGFGGVLDLLDSLLGAAPVAYLFWAMGWVGR